MKKTSVMIVDDHAVVRMGLSAIINLEKEFSVCGESENGEEAVFDRISVKGRTARDTKAQEGPNILLGCAGAFDRDVFLAFAFMSSVTFLAPASVLLQ
mgnify:CR=1 FL=1